MYYFWANYQLLMIMLYSLQRKTTIHCGLFFEPISKFIFKVGVYFVCQTRTFTLFSNLFNVTSSHMFQQLLLNYQCTIYCSSCRIIASSIPTIAPDPVHQLSHENQCISYRTTASAPVIPQERVRYLRRVVSCKLTVWNPQVWSPDLVSW